MSGPNSRPGKTNHPEAATASLGNHQGRRSPAPFFDHSKGGQHFRSYATSHFLGLYHLARNLPARQHGPHPRTQRCPLGAGVPVPQPAARDPASARAGRCPRLREHRLYRQVRSTTLSRPAHNPNAQTHAYASKSPYCLEGNQWRRVPESNRCTRICNPLRHHSANSPFRRGVGRLGDSGGRRNRLARPVPLHKNRRPHL